MWKIFSLNIRSSKLFGYAGMRRTENFGETTAVVEGVPSPARLPRPRRIYNVDLESNLFTDELPGMHSGVSTSGPGARQR
ncbi:hypothetical protein AB833_09170 [Chromatiales bacterium (ex Bugula neritina AB1)]|nr:hypothetical protein AB833_09170 [Chromatiales bacterium (ex Bugula neritina AB1)]